MTPKILLVGKTGQIGSELAVLLPSLGEVTALDRTQLDISNRAEICRAVQQARPQIIVNAAAYTAVDQAEKEPDIARAINSEAPGIFAQEAKRIGASLVHYSTDYIFDGTKKSPYLEDDPPNPLSIYGKTKLAGEEAIRAAGIPHIIFRTAWVYARQGRNFLLTILRLATHRDELRIVRDQVGAPTWNVEIAAATTAILAQFAARKLGGLTDFSELGGTYHMTAAGITTWYDFAVAILSEAAQVPHPPPWLSCALGGLPLRECRITAIPTQDFPTPAQRPQYSVLSNARLANNFGIELPVWRTQLHRAFES